MATCVTSCLSEDPLQSLVHLLTVLWALFPMPLLSAWVLVQVPAAEADIPTLFTEGQSATGSATGKLRESGWENEAFEPMSGQNGICAIFGKESGWKEKESD